jgi:aspartate-semialdehyde dehydrogenase
VGGPIRRSLDDPRALDLFVTGDNLRKGAASTPPRSPNTSPAHL